VVSELLVPEGATVAVGTPIITIGDVAPERADGSTPSADIGSAGTTVTSPVAAQPARTPVLVGYGPRTGPTTRRRRATSPQDDAPSAVSAPVVSVEPAPDVGAKPLAKPPVRKLARDLGVDLAGVVPSGVGGVVTRADVEAAASVAVPASGGRETRVPVKGVRRLTAEAMVASAFTAPHVTEWVQVDVTRTVRLVRRLRGTRAFDGVRLTPLAVVAQALLVAVRHNPEVNATFDAAAGESGEIVTKHYVNLGIATATPRGLMVPVIRDADRMGLHELAQAISDLAETARAGRTPPAALTGGTITITNVGVFGVDGGTPIINPGEAAILAVGQVAERPWVHRGKVRPRWVTTLALSFDHRVVDGEQGSKVLAQTAAVLHDPATALA
jgi:pyruvate dehydrogenase E2 component (dihydrolipoamide acetyltransferase)